MPMPLPLPGLVEVRVVAERHTAVGLRRKGRTWNQVPCFCLASSERLALLLCRGGKRCCL